MKQLQESIGRWVQSLAGKAQARVSVQPARQLEQLVELDAKALRQVNGGVAGSTDMPTKGW